MKGIAVLGSTGSIGVQALEVVRSFRDRLKVVGLAGGRNLELLAQQVQEFQPTLVSYQDRERRGPWPESNRCALVSLEEMATAEEVDVVLVATAGSAGLLPTLAALKAGKTVALANKEPLVMAGGLIMAEARCLGATLLPVDSEPSAVWQCLFGETAVPSRLIITASGGPFRRLSLKDMAQVSPEEALRHPTWKMGRRITLDSATLMNKGFEVIEAHWLFGLPFEKIDVVVHPQSIVHSLVQFADGTVKAQLSYPDMRMPIQLSLSYPERWANESLPRFDPRLDGGITFEPLDRERFPCFALALEAGRRGNTYPTVLCTADQIATERFATGNIAFLDIPRLVEDVLAAHQPASNPSLADILTAELWAQEAAQSWSRN